MMKHCGNVIVGTICYITPKIAVPGLISSLGLRYITLTITESLIIKGNDTAQTF